MSLVFLNEFFPFLSQYLKSATILDLITSPKYVLSPILSASTDALNTNIPSWVPLLVSDITENDQLRPLVQLISSSTVYEIVFPEYNHIHHPQCYREPVWTFSEQNIQLRWPTLIPVSLLGAIIGTFGFAYLTMEMNKKSVGLNTNTNQSKRKKVNQNKTSIVRPFYEISPYWAWSFLYFGCMNISTLFCHNLSPLNGDIFGKCIR